MSLDIEPALKLQRIRQRDPRGYVVAAMLYRSDFDRQFERFDRIDVRRVALIVIASVTAAIFMVTR